MIPRIRHASDLAAWRLCTGCGVCSYICPKQAIEMVDYPNEGIRPRFSGIDCGSCRACLDVCPVVENDHSAINSAPGLINELKESSGPVLEIWQGHATDASIRKSGSSGGAITALSLYCLEETDMHGVLHIGQDETQPWRNRTRMSRGREDLLRATGSRYAPASACDSLDQIENAPGRCVFVGQPSEVTALRKASNLRPELKKNIGLTLSFFCAGSPSSQGTLELLKHLGIDPENIENLRYRGNGWPGKFAALENGNRQPSGNLTYREAWGFLQAFRPFSTHLCPDGGGEDADISCGDPWYQQPDGKNPGSSLIVVRTPVGKEILQGAVAAGYLQLQPATPEQLIESQQNLIQKRSSIWGRIIMLRVLGLPTPKLRGFSLFRGWLALPIKEKLRSTLGTARRIITRNYFKPLNLNLEKRISK